MSIPKLKIGSIIVTDDTHRFAIVGDNQKVIECDGQEAGRDDWPQLFEAIGTQFGDGDGSTTFNVPDMPGTLFPEVGVQPDPPPIDESGEDQ